MIAFLTMQGLAYIYLMNDAAHKETSSNKIINELFNFNPCDHPLDSYYSYFPQLLLEQSKMRENENRLNK